MNSQIEADHLRKSFGKRVALDDLSIQVCAGEVVGLLGPNAAGKTTALSILSGVISPDSGLVRIGGVIMNRSSTEVRRMLGLVPQSIALYPTLSAQENLMFFGGMEGLSSDAAAKRAKQLLEEVNLADRANERVGAFSGGMKRRLNLACAMMHEPCVILLDEPTVGVDPQSREKIFSIVESARDRGAAILYSTHYMEEVEQLADRVVLLDRGKLVAEGSSAELIALAGTEPRIEVTTAKPLPELWAHGVVGAHELPRHGENPGKVSLTLSNVEQAREILRMAELDGGHVVEFYLHRPNLQDAFLGLTGHKTHEVPYGVSASIHVPEAPA